MSRPSLSSWSTTARTRYSGRPVLRPDDAGAYRIRGDVGVTAVFDETEDAFVVGWAVRHTAARYRAMRVACSAKCPGPFGPLSRPFVGSIGTFWRIPENQLAVLKQLWTLEDWGASTP
jgi:hypothetical protein